MKKNYWILAAAAVALAACSNDDTIAVNQGIEEANTINFSTIVEGQTRAAGITTANIESFYVTANRGTDIYFGEAPVQFAKDNSTDPVSYRSQTKYYWPSEGKLDFYAFAPAAGDGSTISRTDSTGFSVTPAPAPADQQDFVYGVVRQQDKATNGDGVHLNFRHAMSNVIIQLKNESTDKKVTVNNVAIGFILPTGTFHPVFKTAEGNQIGFCTNGTGGISNVTDADETGYYITPDAWAADGTRRSYTQTATTTAYAANTTTATPLPTDMILVPQTLVKEEGYSAATAGSGYNGACITVQLKIQDAQDHYLAGTATEYVTAMWPLAATRWLPGHKYTYILDLAGGGYFPTNQENTDENLDPILKNQEIFFLTPTVDEWIAADGIDVPAAVRAP